MSDLATALRPVGPPDRLRPGIVRAVAATRLTVELAGVQVALPFVAGTYAVNDTVLVDGSFVVGKLGTPGVAPPAPVAQPPDPGTVKVRRTVTLLPSTTGTYRAGKWRDTDDLYQGDYGGYGLNTGAAYYGNQLVALRADLGLARSAVLRYSRQRGGDFAAQSPTFWTLSERAQDAGGPARVASAAGTAVPVGGATTWALPGAWLDALLAGTVGGLGIYVGASSPYIVLDGDVASTMALTVTYYS